MPEAQLIRDIASKITEEELKQIRINALDEMFRLKREQLDLESKSTYEKFIIYTKAIGYELYIRTYGYFFDYKTYLEHVYKWSLYWELKNQKAIIPRPSNWVSSQFRQNIERAEGKDDEKKYSND